MIDLPARGGEYVVRPAGRLGEGRHAVAQIPVVEGAGEGDERVTEVKYHNGEDMKLRFISMLVIACVCYFVACVWSSHRRRRFEAHLQYVASLTSAINRIRNAEERQRAAESARGEGSTAAMA